MTELEAVRAIAEPVLSDRGLSLVDIEVVGSGRARTLRLTVESLDPEIANQVDLDSIAAATTPVSVAIDAAEALSGPYTLEVSSPGLERSLRRPGEFRRYVGTLISIKSNEVVSGARRHRGVLLEAGDDGIAVDVEGELRTFTYDDIASARTVFEWGPAPKPGGRKKATTGARSHTGDTPHPSHVGDTPHNDGNPEERLT